MRLKPLVQHCVMAGLLALPIAGWTVGLGKLTLQSGLGQPLAAEVELPSIQPGELDSLVAHLADQRTYAQNKIDYGSALSRVRVALERRGKKKPSPKQNQLSRKIFVTRKAFLISSSRYTAG